MEKMAHTTTMVTKENRDASGKIKVAKFHEKISENSRPLAPLDHQNPKIYQIITLSRQYLYDKITLPDPSAMAHSGVALA